VCVFEVERGAWFWFLDAKFLDERGILVAVCSDETDADGVEKQVEGDFFTEGLEFVRGLRVGHRGADGG